MYYSLTWFDATLVYRFNECHGYRRNYNSETQPFDTLGHIFAKLKDPVESTLFILFLAMTVTTRIHRTNTFTPRQKKKRQLISDHIKGPLVAAFRSPLMKALERSVETLGL